MSAPIIFVPKTHENAQWRFTSKVRKFKEDIDENRMRRGKEEGELEFFRIHKPYEETVVEGNLLTLVGADLVIDLLIGGGGTVLSNANAYVGVGDSSTAATTAQTDLQASTNKLRKGMDTSYPTHTNGTAVIVFSSTFGTSEANYVWNEWAIFNASTAGIMLNRVVAANGTKTTGSWQFQGTLTLS